MLWRVPKYSDPMFPSPVIKYFMLFGFASMQTGENIPKRISSPVLVTFVLLFSQN